MDPYLEHPGIWPGVHNRLIAALDVQLAPQLPSRYYLDVEQRVYIAEPLDDEAVSRPDAAVVEPSQRATGNGADGRDGAATAAAGAAAGAQVLIAEVPIPDRVRHTYLVVRDLDAGEVITAIEVLSPVNKRPGRGRREYEAKRLRTLGTLTHLVEIDLLRSWPPLPMRVKEAPAKPIDYRVLVSRSNTRPWAELHAFTVREALPNFPLPLRQGDDEPTVDLQSALQAVYDRSGYGRRLDYRRNSVPPLRPEDAAWADDLLRRQGLR
jgi:hypothetical protein